MFRMSLHLSVRRPIPKREAGLRDTALLWFLRQA